MTDYAEVLIDAPQVQSKFWRHTQNVYVNSTPPKALKCHITRLWTLKEKNSIFFKEHLLYASLILTTSIYNYIQNTVIRTL